MPSEIVWRPDGLGGSTAYRGDVVVGNVGPSNCGPVWASLPKHGPDEPMSAWYRRFPDEASARAYVESSVREARHE